MRETGKTLGRPIRGGRWIDTGDGKDHFPKLTRIHRHNGRVDVEVKVALTV